MQITPKLNPVMHYIHKMFKHTLQILQQNKEIIDYFAKKDYDRWESYSFM